VADLTGRILHGRYRIEELIGRGGMAEVYKAWDTWRNYHVAIKVMREDLAEDLEFVRRFRREATALAGLAHENIVRFYSFEREDFHRDGLRGGHHTAQRNRPGRGALAVGAGALGHKAGLRGVALRAYGGGDPPGREAGEHHDPA